MVEINVILSIFFFCLFSFFDIIIFNEEILLTLCFLSFLFYCFNTLSDSIAISFETRALKFEQELLLTFAGSNDALTTEFNTNNRLQTTFLTSSIVISLFFHSVSGVLMFFESASSFLYYNISLIKLTELVLLNNNFVIFFQKSCVVQLLYSLILKKSNNDLTFLVSNKKQNKKLTQLKYLSI